MKVGLKHKGFTVVELIVVIVTIAILAAITVVAYRGIQDRAYNTKIQNAASGWADIFEIYMSKSGTYPTRPSGSGGGWGCAGTASNYPATSDLAAGECFHSSGSSWKVSDATATMNDLASAGADLPADVFDSEVIAGSGTDIRPTRGIAFYINAPTKTMYIYYVLKGSNQQCLGKSTSSTTSDGLTICTQNLDTSAVTH